MLDLDKLQNDIGALPEAAQAQVFELVGFLKQRHHSSTSSLKPISFDDQPFVGMWSDRLDMQDSVAWIRQVRQQQWQR
jgi:hypothetical protein